MAVLNYLIRGLLTANIFFTVSLSQEADTLTDFSQPVSPRDYQRALKQGFDTHYFKSKNGRLEPTPAEDFNPKNIDDVYEKGFRNLRLRVATQFYTPPYEDHFFTSFITKLNEVVDKCIQVGVLPVISWIHHEAEAWPTEQDRLNYVLWWTKVAEAMRDKSYHLSFNLFTELGKDYCLKNNSCGNSLRERKDLYHSWTSSVIDAIRAIGGNNQHRILILASPEKLPRGLRYIHTSLYNNDDYLMVEWHDYAAGPYNREECINARQHAGCRYNWVGNGTETQRSILKHDITVSDTYESNFGILSYVAEWMPIDHKRGTISEDEAINFSHFFVKTMKDAGLPWSLNVLRRFYDTWNSRWKTELQYFQGTPINMSHVLDHIVEEINK